MLLEATQGNKCVRQSSCWIYNKGEKQSCWQQHLLCMCCWLQHCAIVLGGGAGGKPRPPEEQEEEERGVW